MKQSILITGGAGYIGSHIGCLLAQYGYTIIIIDSYVHHQLFNPSWAKVYRANIADESMLSYIFTHHAIQTVIHCAASIEVGESVKNPLAYYENNVSNTLTLLKSMVRHHIKRIIFSSSCAVYGIPQTQQLSEDHQREPINPYGHTKRMAEDIINDVACAHNINYVLFRYFNAAGAWPEYNLYEHHIPESHLIPLVIDAALHRKPFSIFGNTYSTYDGTTIRDFLHVRDIAYAHHKALLHLDNALPSDVFNLASGKGTSVLQIVKHVESIVQLPITIKYAQARKGDPACLIADIAKAKTVLDWYPSYSSLENIVQSMMYIKNNCPNQKNLIL